MRTAKPRHQSSGSSGGKFRTPAQRSDVLGAPRVRLGAQLGVWAEQPFNLPPPPSLSAAVPFDSRSFVGPSLFLPDSSHLALLALALGPRLYGNPLITLGILKSNVPTHLRCLKPSLASPNPCFMKP